MNPTFIVNPNSASGAGRSLWEALEEPLIKVFGALQVYKTSESLHAVELTRNAIKEGAESIVSVGGDGTLHEVVNGFFEKGKIINPNVTLGMLGTGTGCDFLRSLSIPRDDLERQIEVIKNGKHKRIDAGIVDLEDAHGEPVRECFINGASFGLGASIIHKVNTSEKRWGTLGFLVPALSAYRKFKPARVVLTMDERMTVEEYIMNVTICNGPFSGAGMRWTTKSVLDDGYLEVVTCRRMPFVKAIFSAFRLYTGTFEKLKEVTVYRVKELKVTSDVGLPIECEGEEPGKLPAKFRIIPKAIPVFIP